MPYPDIFRSEGISRWKEGSRRWPRVACVCGGLVPPLHLIFWLRGSSGEIGFLPIFPEFLLKVEFLHKNETPNSAENYVSLC
jgi:hypothetical protein